jgi:hypothetical protein
MVDGNIVVTSTLISWDIDYNRTEGIRYFANDPIDTKSAYPNYVSVTRYHQPIQLLSIGRVPGDKDVGRGVRLEDYNRLGFFMLDKEGNVVANAKLALENTDYDTANVIDRTRAFFNEGELVALSFLQRVSNEDKRKFEKELDKVEIWPRRGGVNLRKELLDLFNRDLVLYAKERGTEKPNEALLRLRNSFRADSPRGRGLHESYVDSISGVM